MIDKKLLNQLSEATYRAGYEEATKDFKELQIKAREATFLAGYQAGRESLLEEQGEENADTLHSFLAWFINDNGKQDKINEIPTEYEDYLLQEGK